VGCVNLVAENTNAINRSTKILLDSSREAGLDVNTERTECHGCVSSPKFHPSKTW